MDSYVVLRAFLLADAPVAALVGTRIYPVKLPQNVTYPAMTLLRVTNRPPTPLKGKASANYERFQIDCWVRETSGAASFTQVLALGAAVKARLEAYVGPMSDARTSPATVYQTSVLFDDERDFFESDVNGGYFRHSADYKLWSNVHGVAA